ncbi:MAG: hypothetical protein ACOH5I_09440 [Oligoflexus sp.]
MISPFHPGKFLRHLYLVMALAYLSAPAKADTEDWWLPENMLVQSLGYQGAISLGGSYEITDWYALDLLYGYSSSAISGHTVQLLTVKNRFFWTGGYLESDLASRVYLGIGFINGLNSGLFYRLPDRYPRGYYAPTALRSSLHLGWEGRLSQKWSTYGELVYLDSEWAPALVHSQSMNFREFGSFALGLSMSLP